MEITQYYINSIKIHIFVTKLTLLHCFNTKQQFNANNTASSFFWLYYIACSKSAGQNLICQVSSILFYLKWVPKSRLGPNGLSLTMVLPVPVADRETVCVWLSWMATSNLSWKGSMSFRCATTLSSSWLSGATSPSLGSTRQKDFFFLTNRKITSSLLLNIDFGSVEWKQEHSSYFHHGNMMLEHIWG